MIYYLAYYEFSTKGVQFYIPCSITYDHDKIALVVFLLFLL